MATMLLLPLQSRRQAGGVPAAAAHGLDLGVELIDQAGDLELCAVGFGLLQDEAEVLAHPVDGEAEVEAALVADG